jgi:hypothetical protein
VGSISKILGLVFVIAVGVVLLSVRSANLRLNSSHPATGMNEVQSAGSLTEDCSKRQDTLKVEYQTNVTFTEGVAPGRSHFNMGLHFTLGQSRQSRQTFLPYIFIDGRQLELDTSFTIVCGQSKFLNYSKVLTDLSHEEPRVVIMVYSTQEMIPEYLENASYEEVLKLFPEVHKGVAIPGTRESFDADVTLLASATTSDSPSVESSVFYAGPIFQLESVWENGVTRAHDPYTPVFVDKVAADETEYQFHLLYGNYRQTSGFEALTCLLNGKQISAFNDNAIVVTELSTGDVVTIPGSVTVDQAGWNKLQCFRLNSLYRDYEDQSMSVFLSAFLYKE